MRFRRRRRRRMKRGVGRALAVFLVLVCGTAATGAQEGADAGAGEDGWRSVYDRWDVNITAGAGIGFAFSLTAYAGVELLYAQVYAGDEVPFDFGVMAKGMFNRCSRERDGTAAGWLGYGGGLFQTVHLSFAQLEDHSTPFLERFDFYAGFGANYTFVDLTGAYGAAESPELGGIGFGTLIGVNYHLAKWFALNAEFASWALAGGLKVGVLLNI
jgi:hypothetical protein